MNTHLLVRLNELAELRATANALHEALRDKKLAFDREHAAELKAVEDAEIAVEAAERDIRAMAEAEYRETGEKRPAPGVAIRERETMAYVDDDAIGWCRSAGVALVPESLDRKAFEKVAKATRLPFVLYKTEPQVTIATDLGKALAEVSA